MSRIPALTSRQVVRVLKRVGFVEDRQKGSHLVMRNIKTGARTVIPVHSRKNLKRALIHGIVVDAKLTLKEFLKLL